MSPFATACGLALTLSFLAQTPPAAEPDLLRETPVVRAVKRAGPAVVNVYTEEMVARRDSTGDFFRDVFDPRYQRKLETTSLGSGTIIDAQGHVLTNHHVIQRGGKIRVALVDRREFEATIVGIDPDLDLAVLKLHSDKRLPFVPMANSTELLIGETVIAIGNPFGLSNTVTTGVISAVHRNIHAANQTFFDFIQTDASINPGNSGGPLLNIYGQLIGINTAIYGNAQGIGFAIPANRAKRIIADLIAYGRVQLPYVGVDLAAVDEPRLTTLQKQGLHRKNAVQVLKVEPKGPAAQAGLVAGDVILDVDNFPIEGLQEYSAKLRDYTSGDPIKMHVLRSQKRLNIVVTAQKAPLDLADRVLLSQVGIKVDNKATDPIPKVTWVAPNSAASQAGLRAGDRITAVNGQAIADLDSLRQALLDSRRHGVVRLTFFRGRRSLVLRFNL